MRHYEISLEGSGLTYNVGDALGVLPVNCPELVNDLLAALHCTGDEQVKIGDASNVTIDAYGDRKFKGTVEQIANTGKTTGAGIGKGTTLSAWPSWSVIARNRARFSWSGW